MNMRFMFLFVLTAMAMYWTTAHSAGMQSAPFSFKAQDTETLSFYNTHTHETFTLEVMPNKLLKQAALRDINHFLRDHRTGDVKKISPELIALLVKIKREAQAQASGKEIVFHVISGYRSPKTNAMLRSNGGGQAKKSRHMHGDAIDIRVPGFSTARLRNIAWCQQQGGVGYYSGSNFIHVDTHRVRFWNWSPANVKCEKVLTQ